MTPSDPLIDSYRAAQKLQNETGPSELTRRRILAHAEQLANSKPSKNDTIVPNNTTITTDSIANQATNTPAANDSQWKIRALASVAVFGIAGLLMLQLSKDAPEEFLPKAKPPAAVERSVSPAIAAGNESKTNSDKSVQAPAPVAAAPAVPAAAKTAPAVIKPAPAPDSQLTKSSKKDNSSSRNDLEMVAPKAEALAEKATEFTPPPTASAPAAPRATAQATINANTKLFNAIQNKDAAAMKLALDGGDDKNAKNREGTTALSMCVQSEQLNLVRQLIAAGADVNALDASGVSPLAHARNRGFADITNSLLNAGAK